MENSERPKEQPIEMATRSDKLPWHAPILTVSSVAEETRNAVNQLPYDLTNVRS